MMLSEETNKWGEPVRPKKIVPEKAPEPVMENCFVLEDLHMTLRFLSEITEPELTIEQKKEQFLKNARIAREDIKSKKETFLFAMEDIGVNRDEAIILWNDADI